MTTAERSIPSVEPSSSTRKGYPARSLAFDAAAVALSGWFIFGMFLDGWAHNHGKVDNTFFTPWHLVLYSGFSAVGLLLVGTHFRNVMKGHAWLRALPAGYMLALVGVLIFGIAGVSDFGWHSLFGFEVDLEALLSPAHLALATGSLLFLTGPVRSYWQQRGQPQGWREFLPLVLALTFVVSLLTFFTQYATLAGFASAMVGFPPSQESWAYDTRGTVGAIVQMALLTGTLLFAVRRWKLPFGTFTLMFTLNMLLMVWMLGRQNAEYLLVLPLTLAGFIADTLIARLKPSASNPAPLRFIAPVVAFIGALAFYLTLNQVGMMLEGRGLWWQIHMWLGVPFVAGIGAFLLTFLAVPPALPADAAI